MTYKTDPHRFLTQAQIDKIEDFAVSLFVEGKEDRKPLTYVMTDIHGMLDPLLQMLGFIKSQQTSRTYVEKLVFMGDYVDRGPHSAGVIAAVRLLEEICPKDSVVSLMGNHEDMLLGDLYKNKGYTFYDKRTIASFEGKGNRAKIPEDVVEWLHGLPLWHWDELHYYVHAGFRKGVEIKNQQVDDVLWIREQFLNHEHDFGKHVLHGHTPVNSLFRLPFRTNLDTGCVFGGPMTCAEVSQDERQPTRFLQIKDEREKVLYL